MPLKALPPEGTNTLMLKGARRPSSMRLHEPKILSSETSSPSPYFFSLQNSQLWVLSSNNTDQRKTDPDLGLGELSGCC